MDTITDFITILGKPISYIVIVLIVIFGFIKPLFKYLSLRKKINDQLKMQREYKEHRERIKQALKKQHEEIRKERKAI